MRATLRLLASVQRSTQFLEPGAPTGLTGLLTHHSPRSTLLYTYHSTLEKLKQFPEHSVYRQSTETLTRHRMSVVESVKPAGLEEWQKRVESIIDEYPDAFRKIQSSDGSGFNYIWKEGPVHKETEADKKPKPQLEGIRSKKEKAGLKQQLERDTFAEAASVPKIESEPSLTVEQVNEIESKIGAGLIEEIIQVAEGESVLADTMFENKVWEDLADKPQPGQWSYFDRDTHTGKTQAP